jgi:putative DNA primase/helicase
VRLFLEQHGESRFSPAWDRTTAYVAANGEEIEKVKTDRSTITRAGFRKAGDDGWTYYILTEVWRREVCKGLDAKAVAGAMAERGWLLKEGRNLTRKERIPGEGNQRVHVIPPAFLSADP